MMTEKGELRVWWISNPPSKPFQKKVKTIKDGIRVLQLLAEYDLHLGELIYANASGLEIYVGDVPYETNEGWEEYMDDDGNDIWGIIDGD